MLTLVDDPSCFLHHCDQDDKGLKDDIVGAYQLGRANWSVILIFKRYEKDETFIS